MQGSWNHVGETNENEESAKMKNLKVSVVVLSVACAVVAVAGCAAPTEEPSASAQQGLVSCVVEDVEPLDWPELASGGTSTPPDPGGGDPGDGDLAPESLRPLAKSACESSCDAAFPSAPGVYGSCSNIFLTACYVACRGADSAKAACGALRGGRAPRGWVKALQRICAISGL